MPAAVETLGNMAAFASRAVPPWHALGHVFPEDQTVTTAEMLELAHLHGWNVRLRPLDTDARPTTDAKVYEVLRNNPFDGGLDRLGLVGGRYTTYQNEETFAFGDNILDGGGRWETAGAILGGTQVFGSMAIDRSIVVGAGEADDVTEIYLLIHTSHDGTKALSVFITPVRVVCKNTLDLAFRGVAQRFTIKHTQAIEGKVEAARKTLGLTFAYADTFEAEANRLYEAAVSDAKFDEIVKGVYPEPEADASKAAVTRWENTRDLLNDIWRSQADGPDTMSTIRGTGWGAVQALTERLDWYRRPRAGDVESALRNASGLDKTTTNEKNRIQQVVSSLVLS